MFREQRQQRRRAVKRISGQSVGLTNLRSRVTTSESLRATIRPVNITYNGVIHCHKANNKANLRVLIISFLIHIMNSYGFNCNKFKSKPAPGGQDEYLPDIPLHFANERLNQPVLSGFSEGVNFVA